MLSSFNHKGKRVTVRNNADAKSNSGDSHAPAPFFVSTSGYGIVVDTARYVSFYCGSSAKKGSGKETHLLWREKIVSIVEDLYRPIPFEREQEMIIEIPVAKGVDIYLIEDIIC